MLVYIVTAVVLLLYLVVVYFLGNYFQTDIGAWIFRILFWLLGLTGGGIFLWYYYKQSKRKPGTPDDAPDQVDLMIRDAQERLASSRLGKKGQLKNLPLVLLTGVESSGKTTVMLQSGTEPELLAGHTTRDGQTAPTPAANLWYAGKTVFVELGGKLAGDSQSWGRLIRRIRPSRIRSLFRKGAAPPRAAVVCVDCDTLIKADPGKGPAEMAKEIHDRLGEVSQKLGIHLPVYVVFTKLDRLPFFTDYARNMSNEEAAQIVGATLPAAIGVRPGVYGERETHRLTAAFNNAFQDLCDKRLVMLARENHAPVLPNIYEFPREFSKLRAGVVKFLVELCRPSQLAVGAFLRGFYFSGVRPVIETEGIRTAHQEQPASGQRGEGFGSATQMFRIGEIEQNPEDLSTSAASGGHKVPQWVFLSHLFGDILLQDRVAKATSGVSSSKSFGRRLLFASLAALCLLYLVFATVSYFGNSGMEDDVLAAARGTSGTGAGGQVLPSLDTLQRLDAMRQTLADIERYRVEGRPASLGWGLYVGEKLYEPLLRVYFDRFHQVMLGPTLAGLAGDLRELPSEPSPLFEEGPTYTKLKAYLIPTELPPCSTRDFLSPALGERWVAGQQIDEERLRLGMAQFDYYATLLPARNPYDPPLPADTLSVEKGRRYLAQLEGVERIYLSMLGQASANAPSILFNRDFPGSEAVVVNRKEIRGAFTKAGWPVMDEALNNLARADRSGCDSQVMGQYARPAGDLPALQQQLRARYYREYIAEWLDFLKQTQVVRYRSAGDAAAKLQRTSGPQSPLLAALWLASTHTSDGPPEVAQAFQPPQFMAPPQLDPSGFAADSNSSYLQDLFQLGESWSQLAAAPQGAEDPMLMDAVTATGSSAKSSTNQLALNFRGDTQGSVASATRRLVLAPIDYTERLLRALGPDPNKDGKGLCTEIAALQKKFPFDPNSPVEVSMDEVGAIFHPQFGSLWELYNKHLAEALVLQGGRFVSRPGGKIRLNPAFVEFFNRVASISYTFYPEGSDQSGFEYVLTPQSSDTLEEIVLYVDGNRIISRKQGGQPQRSSWPGNSSGVRLLGSRKGATLDFVNYPKGLWSGFKFFFEADVIPRTGSGIYEWRPKSAASGQPLRIDNRPVVVRYLLDHGDNAPVFQKGYLRNLGCISQVTR